MPRNSFLLFNSLVLSINFLLPLFGEPLADWDGEFIAIIRELSYRRMKTKSLPIVITTNEIVSKIMVDNLENLRGGRRAKRIVRVVRRGKTRFRVDNRVFRNSRLKLWTCISREPSALSPWNFHSFFLWYCVATFIVVRDFFVILLQCQSADISFKKNILCPSPLRWLERHLFTFVMSTCRFEAKQWANPNNG